MWPALEGFIVILALIFIFGIISLPPRAKKARYSNSAMQTSNGAGAGIGIPAAAVSTIPDVKMQQDALDKAYSPDQKISAPSEASKVV